MSLGLSHAGLNTLRLLGAACAGGVGALALFLTWQWWDFWRKTRTRHSMAPVLMNAAVFLTMAAIVGVRIYLGSTDAPLSPGDVSTWISIVAFAVALVYQFRNLASAQNAYEKLADGPR